MELTISCKTAKTNVTVMCKNIYYMYLFIKYLATKVKISGSLVKTFYVSCLQIVVYKLY